MKRTWTIIGVRDVASSAKWYQSLFGQPETPLNHDYFGQILDTDGTVLLCLHQWGSHEHPSLTSPEKASPGNGPPLILPRRRFRRGTEESSRHLDKASKEITNNFSAPVGKCMQLINNVSPAVGGQSLAKRSHKSLTPPG
jgi:hypothetical protein